MAKKQILGRSALVGQITGNRLLLAALIVGASSVPLFLPACSDTDPGKRDEPTAQSAGAVTVSSANGCTVEFTKLNYDNVGTDTSEFIELKVTKSADSGATTLGQCGLGSIALVNGATGSQNCLTYLTIPLASVTIPNDGYVVICNADGPLGNVCDVDPGGNDIIQNGPDDQISFRAVGAGDGGVGGTEVLHVIYEGTATCSGGDGGVPLVSIGEDQFFGTDAGFGDAAVPELVAVWCGTYFQYQDISLAQPGQAYTCADLDAGTDAATEAATDAATEAATDAATEAATDAATEAATDAATEAATDAATGGTGGTDAGTDAATGGTAGSATGGTAGSATGGTAGSATGGTSAGGTSAGGTSAGGTSAGGTSAGGTSAGGTSAGGTSAGGTGAKDAGVPTGGSGDDGGCGCRVAGNERSANALWTLVLAAAMAFARSRRRR